MKVLIDLSEVSVETRKALAKCTSDIDVLKALAEDEDWHVRCEVVRNVNATLDMLQKLADDNDERVRIEVIDNVKVTLDILQKLAKDCSSDVRLAVAKSNKATSDILLKLIQDEYDTIANAAFGKLRIMRKMIN